jgi:hypothetical protein
MMNDEENHPYVDNKPLGILGTGGNIFSLPDARWALFPFLIFHFSFLLFNCFVIPASLSSHGRTRTNTD